MDRQRILIVEDSPTMRQLLVFALRRLKNVEVVEAQDGMDGLRKVTSDGFDLALIDINMPVMDGLKLISLIRAEQSVMSMPICVITTEGATEDRERALALASESVDTGSEEGLHLVPRDIGFDRSHEVGFIVGQDGMVLRSKDGGRSWALVLPPQDDA